MTRDGDKYLIIANIPMYQQQYKLPAVVSKRLDSTRTEFHCSVPRGAFALVAKKTRDVWQCENVQWTIESVIPISSSAYLEALEIYVHTSQR